MRDHNRKCRSVLGAMLTGILTMLIFGIAYHALAGRRAVGTNGPPIDPNALARLPLQMGQWKGQDTLLDLAVGRATGADTYVNRRYVRPGGSEAVSLFIGAGSSVNEVMGHTPERCYPLAGSMAIGERSKEVPLGDGRVLPCMIYEFAPPDPATAKLTVLHYCYADGRYFNDVHKVLAQGLRGFRTVGVVAQIHIVTSSRTLTDTTAEQAVTDFAIALAGPLEALFESLDSQQEHSEADEIHE